MKRFDLIVIGSGTAATTAAHRCASAGWSVAIVDELPYGGTCALRGCDPKKLLRRAAELIDAVQLMSGKGVEAEALRVSWPDLMTFKRSFTAQMPGNIEASLASRAIETLHGSARFVGSNRISIDGTELEGRCLLIASGARPRELRVPGAGLIIDSTQFMELDVLPEQLLFVGGGFVSFEFAHIAARAGSAVRIVDRRARPLGNFEPELVDRLITRTRALGVDFHGDTELLAVRQAGRRLAVTANADGHDKTWAADLVVHGAGRVPAIEHLEPAAAGVEFTERGITVNEYLQSVSNEAIYAAGDCSDSKGWPLTPVSALEGRVAASNMLHGNHETPDYRGIPTAVFTIPELARVGLLESEVVDLGLSYRTRLSDTGSWYSNVRVGESCAAVKVLIDDDSDELLGAHLLGPGYAELVNVFGLAIQNRMKAADLKRMVSAYPTVVSDLGSML
jgi:glutathione reductase (NADPH)